VARCNLVREQSYRFIAKQRGFSISLALEKQINKHSIRVA